VTSRSPLQAVTSRNRIPTGNRMPDILRRFTIIVLSHAGGFQCHDLTLLRPLPQYVRLSMDQFHR